MNLAGVVVLYNPSDNVYDYINCYIKKLNILYIIDNSEKENSYLYKKLSELNNARIIVNNQNMGIAHALNQAVIIAIEEGYHYLLCMDQDSKFNEVDLQNYIHKIDTSNDKDKVAVYAPIIDKKFFRENKSRYVNEVITSGSVINLDICKVLGKFKEEYFIYVVDYEYCWRARKNNYKVKLFYDVFLRHQLNDYIEKKDNKGNLKIKKDRDISNYAFYYAIRNNLYMLNMYKDLLPNDYKRKKKEFFHLWTMHFLKSKHKFNKAKFILYAIKDYRNNIDGKCKY